MKAKSKWKVGDLVTLSARGAKIEANWNLWRFQDNKRVTEGFGIVTRISTSGAGLDHLWLVPAPTMLSRTMNSKDTNRTKNVLDFFNKHDTFSIHFNTGEFQ